MKKTFITILMVLVTTSLVAQKKNDFTVEQQATLKTKKMTLALDLTENQQDKIYNLNVDLVQFMKSKKGIRKNNNTSSEEKYQHKVEMLDRRISYKAELKKVLSKSQYETWNRIQMKRTQKHHYKKTKCNKQV